MLIVISRSHARRIAITLGSRPRRAAAWSSLACIASKGFSSPVTGGFMPKTPLAALTRGGERTVRNARQQQAIRRDAGDLCVARRGARRRCQGDVVGFAGPHGALCPDAADHRG